MRRVANDVWLISWGVPRRLFNAYLVGDVLVDAGVRQSAWWIAHELRRTQLRAHALTHVHPDHQGSSARICDRLGVPLWCGDADADAMVNGTSNYPPGRLPRLLQRHFAGDAHAVARRLREGDELAAGFEVLATPGHSPGHLSFWRESDRTLLAGEVMLNLGVRLTETVPWLTTDIAANRRSARRLAALQPNLVLFAHGRPLRGTARLDAFVARLPT
jgi:glyoxylase-like metal-dependent hydrolase (beta-lactamase superfamily II)